NGCGKTTLLKLILGELKPDIGKIHTKKNLSIGYLPQEPQFSDDKTVLQELHSTAQDILKKQNRLHESAESLSGLSGDKLKEAMKQYDRLSAEFESCGGYKYENKIKEIAAGLGLDENFYNVKTSQLSGGQKSRLGLAKVLLSDAELLLLDEPTNHLDFEATIWLENYLRDFNGSALIVSHDRFLLDRLVTKIIEIKNRDATIFPGNYSNYREEKEKRDLELERQYQARLEFVERTRDFIARNKDQEGMRKTARGRKTRLNRLLHENPDFLEKPTYEKNLRFEFAAVEQKSRREQAVLTCENLTKKYGQLCLFDNFNLEVLSGHRLGIIGPNGTGKTTLLKMAMRMETSGSGKISLKSNLSVGYLDQEGIRLNDENTVLEEAAEIKPDLLPQQLRGKLGAFLFSGDDVFKKVSQLSGGERNRLAIFKLVLSEPQVLILDEPTNHLDIPSIETLENALQNYSGTVIMVSHDRYFLDRTVDELLVLGVDELGRKKFGGSEMINGSVSQYLELIEQRRSAQKPAEKIKTKTPQPKTPQKTTPKELLQFAMWSFEKLEQAVEETEKQITAITEQFGNTYIYKNPNELSGLQYKLDEKKQYLELLYRAYERKLNA
ncbi:MAG: ABC-F family ATP-binding cassette domain-containing protein, partial [Phycisphaerae bacterium]